MSITLILNIVGETLDRYQLLKKNLKLLFEIVFIFQISFLTLQMPSHHQELEEVEDMLPCHIFWDGSEAHCLGFKLGRVLKLHRFCFAEWDIRHAFELNIVCYQVFLCWA